MPDIIEVSSDSDSERPPVLPGPLAAASSSGDPTKPDAEPARRPAASKGNAKAEHDEEDIVLLPAPPSTNAGVKREKRERSLSQVTNVAAQAGPSKQKDVKPALPSKKAKVEVEVDELDSSEDEAPEGGQQQALGLQEIALQQQAQAQQMLTGSHHAPSHGRRKTRGEMVFSRYATAPRANLVAFPSLPSSAATAAAGGSGENKPVHEQLDRVRTIQNHIATGKATGAWIPRGLDEASDLVEATRGKPVEGKGSAEWTDKRREALGVEVVALAVKQACRPPIGGGEVKIDAVKKQCQRLVIEWEGGRAKRKETVFEEKVAPALNDVLGLRAATGDDKDSWLWLDALVERVCGDRGRFGQLLEDANADELHRLYIFLAPMRGYLATLHGFFSAYAIRYANAKIASHLAALPPSTAPTPQQVLACLTEAIALPARMVERCFANDAGFSNELERACKVIMRDNEMTKRQWTGGKCLKPAFVLAHRLDELVKSDAPANSEISKLLHVLRCLDDKDFFASIKHLARRLLSDTCSIDREAALVDRLDGVLGGGPEAAGKMVRMIKDRQVSDDLLKRFKERKQPDDPDVNFVTLSTACWPARHDPIPLSVPSSLVPVQTRFLQHYERHHSGRRLNWLWNLSRVELKIEYAAQPHVLLATFVQATVLLLFNDGAEKLSVDDIVKGSGLEPDTAKETVDLLVKQRLLNEIPNGYEINLGFKYKSIRVPIASSKPAKSSTATGSAPAAEGPDDAEVAKEVSETRRLVLQAAIVRTMKGAKRMAYGSLFQEVAGQAKFSIQASAFKRELEVLIEKAYLQRDPAERDTFEYLA